MGGGATKVNVQHCLRRKAPGTARNTVVARKCKNEAIDVSGASSARPILAVRATAARPPKCRQIYVRRPTMPAFRSLPKPPSTYLCRYFPSGRRDSRRSHVSDRVCIQAYFAPNSWVRGDPRHSRHRRRWGEARTLVLYHAQERCLSCFSKNIALGKPYCRPTSVTTDAISTHHNLANIQIFVE